MVTEVSIECKLARDYAMVNMPDTLAYLLIKIIPSSTAQLGSMPLNIGLVLDVSRSMKGQKLTTAVEAIKHLVRSLREEDWISITTFSDKAEVVVPAIKVLDKSAIFKALDKIHTIGATKMFHGIEASSKEMCKGGLRDKINRMILLTDGETEGEEYCRSIASYQRQNDIVISALGIGKRYNENLLAEISDVTLGHFSHLKSFEQIAGIFQRELETAIASVISNVTIYFHLEEGVRLENLDRIFPSSIRLQPIAEDNGTILKAELGNLVNNDLTIIGARLRLPVPRESRLRIARIRLLYSIPSLQITEADVSADIVMEFTDNQELCSRVDKEVVNYFNQINTRELIEEAIRQTKSGKTNEAVKSLSQAQVIIEKSGNLALNQSIQKALDDLEHKGVISADSLKTIKAVSHRTVQVNKSELN